METLQPTNQSVNYFHLEKNKKLDRKLFYNSLGAPLSVHVEMHYLQLCSVLSLFLSPLYFNFVLLS